jgi:hypothetical protein
MDRIINHLFGDENSIGDNARIRESFLEGLEGGASDDDNNGS